MRTITLFCITLFSLSLMADPVAASAKTGDGSLVAVLDYKGGFVKELYAPVESKALFNLIRIDVPSFCGGIEILGVSTYSEGIPDPAVIKNEKDHIYQIANGPARIGGVSLMINGPVGSGCTIPIFEFKGDGGSGSTGNILNEHIHLCNKYPYPIKIALAYVRDGEWVTEGWFAAAPNTCARPYTTGRISGTLYTYAISDNGVVWGGATGFCVPFESPFVAEQNTCLDKSKGSYRTFYPNPIPDNGTVIKLNFK